MRVRGIRGAVTVEADDPERIVDATARVVREMVERNGLEPDDVISLVITATGDLTSAFPAAAVRRVGLPEVPVLCARELSVEGAMPRVIRVLMHAHSDRPDVVHVYLGEARSLREDLP